MNFHLLNWLKKTHWSFHSSTWRLLKLYSNEVDSMGNYDSFTGIDCIQQPKSQRLVETTEFERVHRKLRYAEWKNYHFFSRPPTMACFSIKNLQWTSDRFSDDNNFTDFYEDNSKQNGLLLLSEKKCFGNFHYISYLISFNRQFWAFLLK